MKKSKSTIVITITIMLFIILHLTPSLAIRTRVFFMGYFVNAIKTDVVDDVTHNNMDKELLESENAKCYTLTNPPIEKATQGVLRNYKVVKIGPLYFASYYGEC